MQMDKYAAMFGIELVPCIQTLAHLECVLRWQEYADVRDIDNILLVDEPKTYELIRDMFCQMAKSLHSRRINIGMDEAHMLGLGKHLERWLPGPDADYAAPLPSCNRYCTRIWI